MVGGQAEDMGPCGTESEVVLSLVDHSQETRPTPKELLRHMRRSQSPILLSEDTHTHTFPENRSGDL